MITLDKYRNFFMSACNKLNIDIDKQCCDFISMFQTWTW